MINNKIQFTFDHLRAPPLKREKDSKFTQSVSEKGTELSVSNFE